MPDESGHPHADEMSLGVLLAALADEHRRGVVRNLIADSEDTEHPCANFNLPQARSTRSHHFRVLREAGVVRQVDYGNKSGITLRRAELDGRFPGLLDLLASEA